ncbi:MAG TPA: AraC family transcriptional regulator, partial [Vicinamibacterales bacterium]|nr:AraC family transcriptional regulator [Vicinamibacterales bacterium]
MISAPKNFTRGTILRWRRVPGLELAEVEYEAGLRVPRHIHAHARLVLVLSGSVTEIRGQDSSTFGPSTLLFRRAEEPHAYAIGSSGATCLVVDIEPAWLARVRDEAPVLAKSAAFRGGLAVHLAHRLHGEFRLRDEVSRLAIQSLALGVLAEMSRRVTRAAERAARVVPMWLQQARALVELHFAHPLPLTSVAERVGVHPVHLARTFRRCYQTTLGGYVRQLRIEFARRELGGPASLSAIAAAAGFCDQSHFSRSFKRYTGMTPAEYRLS